MGRHTQPICRARPPRSDAPALLTSALTGRRKLTGDDGLDGELLDRKQCHRRAHLGCLGDLAGEPLQRRGHRRRAEPRDQRGRLRPSVPLVRSMPSHANRRRLLVPPAIWPRACGFARGLGKPCCPKAQGPVYMVGMTLPPHTGTNAPCTKLARSEARNATTFAISWSVPRRPSGTAFR